MQCHACSAEMSSAPGSTGVLWACKSCMGRAVNLPVLKKRHDKQFLQALWQEAHARREIGSRACPSCAKTMNEATLETENGALTLDVCQSCFLVWFDAGELEQLPRNPNAGPEPKELPQEARVALAMARVQSIQSEADLKEVVEAASRSISPFGRRRRTTLIEDVVGLLGAVVRAFI